MKYLFLDIDGVLNCAKYFRERKSGRNERPNDFDPHRVLVLHRILEATGAKVVVSSSWRLNEESLEEVRKMVSPHYHDFTPHLWERDVRTPRGAEILAWFFTNHQLDHEKRRYAILDDETDAGMGHGDNFFKTSWQGEGLTEEIAEKVIAHLNAGDKPEELKQ